MSYEGAGSGFVNAKCPECGGETIKRSALVAGLASCEHCGCTFTPPEEAMEVKAWSLGVADAEAAEQRPELTIPDSATVVYGWRAWELRTPKTQHELAVLRSVTYAEAYWTPRMPMVATCGRGQYHRASKKNTHDPPGETCGCGLYAAKTYEEMMRQTYRHYDEERNGHFHVIGKVKLWGGVIEGTQGWRAQIGYPAELYLPFEGWHLAEVVEKAYGVEVGLKNWLID